MGETPEVATRQLTLDFALLQQQKKHSRRRAKPAICACCGRYHPECAKFYITQANRRKSKEKRPVCPHCQGTLTKFPTGRGLPSVGATTIETFTICPEKALYQGGPDGFRRRLPATLSSVIGLEVHRTLQLCTQQTFKSAKAALGRRGLADNLGGALIAPGNTGYSRGIQHLTLEEGRDAFTKAASIVQYALGRMLVRSVKQWKLDSSIEFIQPEISFRVTLQILSVWFGLGWERNALNSTLAGRVDLVTLHHTCEGYEGPVVRVTDYKTFLPRTDELGNFTHSLQMRLYGLWAAWCFQVPLKNVLLQIIFLGQHWKEGATHRVVPVEFTDADPGETLEQFRRFLTAYHGLKSRAGAGAAAAQQEWFPPNPGPQCSYCPHRETCSTHGQHGVVCADCGAQCVWRDTSRGRRPVCPHCGVLGKEAQDSHESWAFLFREERASGNLQSRHFAKLRRLPPLITQQHKAGTANRTPMRPATRAPTRQLHNLPSLSNRYRSFAVPTEDWRPITPIERANIPHPTTQSHLPQNLPRIRILTSPNESRHSRPAPLTRCGSPYSLPTNPYPYPPTHYSPPPHLFKADHPG